MPGGIHIVVTLRAGVWTGQYDTQYHAYAKGARGWATLETVPAPWDAALLVGIKKAIVILVQRARRGDEELGYTRLCGTSAGRTETEVAARLFWASEVGARLARRIMEA